MEEKVYRPSGFMVRRLLRVCVVSALLGLAVITGFFIFPQFTVGTESLVAGVSMLIIGISYGWGIYSPRLVASEDGLTFRNFFRLRRIPWNSVLGVETRSFDSTGKQGAVIVRLDDRRRGEVRLMCGPRERAEQFAGELGEALRSYGEAAAAGGGGRAAEADRTVPAGCQDKAEATDTKRHAGDQKTDPHRESSG